jgi:excisionase family DNA binding protein
MKSNGNRRTGAGAETIRALRSVMLATGGNAKVRELIQLLTAVEVAETLGVSLSYVQHATARGEIPCVRIGKGDPRYRVMDLIAWQEARKRAAVE